MKVRKMVTTLKKIQTCVNDLQEEALVGKKDGKVKEEKRRIRKVREGEGRKGMKEGRNEERKKKEGRKEEGRKEARKGGREERKEVRFWRKWRGDNTSSARFGIIAKPLIFPLL